MHDKVVEAGRSIDLCPKANHAGVLESVVTNSEQGPAVEITRDAVANHRDSNRVPFARFGLNSGGGELLSLAVYDLVDTVVTFERVEGNCRRP